MRNPLLASLLQNGYSPFIIKVAAAQVALSMCYRHSMTDTVSSEGHCVYEVTWARGFSGQAACEGEGGSEGEGGGAGEEDNTCEAAGSVDYGNGESLLTHQAHYASLTDCSCNFRRRWGCFCRHMACVYYITNTASPPPGVMSTAWIVEGSEQEQFRRETFESFLGAGTEQDVVQGRQASDTTPMALSLVPRPAPARGPFLSWFGT